MAASKHHMYMPLGGHTDNGERLDWFAHPPRSHHVRGASAVPRRIERHRSGQHLVGRKAFTTTCARDELSIQVQLETPDTARRLTQMVDHMASDMHEMEKILLESFIEKDYDDDLLLLTAVEEHTGKLIGMVFWRYLRSKHDEFWQKVNVDLQIATDVNALPVAKTTPPNSWVLIELLCTDRSYRGCGIGKLLMVGALAYSAVKDGKTAAVLVVADTPASKTAKGLYTKLGFEEVPDEFCLPPDDAHHGLYQKHMLVMWNIKRALRSLRLADVNGSRNGTRVAQLENSTSGGVGEDLEIARLDSMGSANMVERLIGEQSRGSEAGVRLSVGSNVVLWGLQNQSELNGARGKCEQWVEESGRWQVRLQNGERKALRLENLQVV